MDQLAQVRVNKEYLEYLIQKRYQTKTFGEVAEWDHKANLEIDELSQQIDQIDLFIIDHQERIQQINQKASFFLDWSTRKKPNSKRKSKNSTRQEISSMDILENYEIF